MRFYIFSSTFLDCGRANMNRFIFVLTLVNLFAVYSAPVFVMHTHVLFIMIVLYPCYFDSLSIVIEWKTEHFDFV